MDSHIAKIRRDLQAAAIRFAAQTRVNAIQSMRLSARLSGLWKNLQPSLLAPLHGTPSFLSPMPALALSLDAYSLVSQHLIACLDDLLSAGERVLNDVSQQTEANGLASECSTAPWSGLPRLRLEGKPGQTLETAFVIHNDLAAPVDFNLRCQTAEDSPLDKYHLDFTPASDRLAPDAQRVVRLQTRLAADIAPATYWSQVTIEGLPETLAGGQHKRFCIELVVAA